MASRIKSARIEGARAVELRPSSVAFASGLMETHLLTGERNISPQSHRGLAFPVRLYSSTNEARYE